MFKRWERTHKCLHYYGFGDGPQKPLAVVWRVRVGRWRARVGPEATGKRDGETFNRMEEACAWAEARLPLYELPGLA